MKKEIIIGSLVLSGLMLNNNNNDNRSVDENQSKSGEINNNTIHDAVELWIKDRDEAIKIYGEIGSWDTSKVTDMSYLFFEKSSFNDDISNWDVSNVTNMNSMFEGAEIFNQPLNSWNIFNVKKKRKMFLGAKSMGYRNKPKIKKCKCKKKIYKK